MTEISLISIMKAVETLKTKDPDLNI